MLCLITVSLHLLTSISAVLHSIWFLALKNLLLIMRTDIRVVVPSLQTGCGMFMLVENQPNFIRDWLLYASTDIDILKTALLTACRHRSAFNSDTEYELRATQYKIKQVQAIRKGITEDSTPARRTAITRAIMLALDEVTSPMAVASHERWLTISYKIYLNDLSMASRHVTGAVRIIQASGGADVLGLTSLVRYLIGASVFGKGLLEEDPSLQGIRSHLKTDLLRF